MNNEMYRNFSSTQAIPLMAAHQLNHFAKQLRKKNYFLSICPVNILGSNGVCTAMSRIAWIEVKWQDILLTIISSGILDLLVNRLTWQHFDTPNEDSLMRLIEKNGVKNAIQPTQPQTSHPKARDGHRYPCHASVFSNVRS